MKWLLYIVLLVVLFFVGNIALQFIASESGEVVVLTTTDSAGNSVETRLWVVDHDGNAWLRSGSDQSGWYQRLSAAPRVSIVRGETTLLARAEPDTTARTEVNDLMNAKYGWADDYIDWLFGREDAIPIRLVPLAE